MFAVFFSFLHCSIDNISVDMHAYLLIARDRALLQGKSVTNSVHHVVSIMSK